MFRTSTRTTGGSRRSPILSFPMLLSGATLSQRSTACFRSFFVIASGSHNANKSLGRPTRFGIPTVASCPLARRYLASKPTFNDSFEKLHHISTTSLEFQNRWASKSQYTGEIATESSRARSLYKSNRHAKLLRLWNEKYTHTDVKNSRINYYFGKLVLCSLRRDKSSRARAARLAEQLLDNVTYKTRHESTGARILGTTIATVLVQCSPRRDKLENMIQQFYNRKYPIAEISHIFIMSYFRGTPFFQIDIETGIEKLIYLVQRYRVLKSADILLCDVLLELMHLNDEKHIQFFMSKLAQWKFNFNAPSLQLIFEAAQKDILTKEQLETYVVAASELLPESLTPSLIHSIANLSPNTIELDVPLTLWKKLSSSSTFEKLKESGPFIATAYQLLGNLIQKYAYEENTELAIQLYAESTTFKVNPEAILTTNLVRLLKFRKSDCIQFLAGNIEREMNVDLDTHVVTVAKIDIDNLDPTEVMVLFKSFVRWNIHRPALKLLPLIYQRMYLFEAPTEFVKTTIESYSIFYQKRRLRNPEATAFNDLLAGPLILYDDAPQYPIELLAHFFGVLERCLIYCSWVETLVPGSGTWICPYDLPGYPLNPRDLLIRKLLMPDDAPSDESASPGSSSALNMQPSSSDTVSSVEPSGNSLASRTGDVSSVD